MSDLKVKEEVRGPDEVDIHDEVLVNDILMNDAIDGENDEHAMGMWQAVKTYPWACLWAFTFCFTIVSRPQSPHAPSHLDNH